MLGREVMDAALPPAWSTAAAGRPPAAARTRSGFGLVAKHHPAFFKIVRGHLDRHAIARNRLDPVALHAPGRIGDDLVPIVELDAEPAVRQDVSHGSFEFQRFFLSHYLSLAGPEASMPCSAAPVEIQVN